jgi:hypothetical protein
MKRLWLVFLAIAFTALGVGFAWHQGRTAVADFRHRNHAFATASDYDLQGSCRTRLFVIAICDVALVPLRGGNRRELSYLIFGRDSNQAVVVLRSTSNGYLTTSLGQDYLGNRMLSLLALTGAIVLMGIGGAVAALRQPPPAA